MNLKDFIGPLFALVLIALGYYWLRAQERNVKLSEKEHRLPRSWRANLLQHSQEQERLGHSYGQRSIK